MNNKKKLRSNNTLKHDLAPLLTKPTRIKRSLRKLDTGICPVDSQFAATHTPAIEAVHGALSACSRLLKITKPKPLQTSTSTIGTCRILSGPNDSHTLPCRGATAWTLAACCSHAQNTARTRGGCWIKPSGASLEGIASCKREGHVAHRHSWRGRKIRRGCHLHRCSKICHLDPSVRSTRRSSRFSFATLESTKAVDVYVGQLVRDIFDSFFMHK